MVATRGAQCSVLNNWSEDDDISPVWAVTLVIGLNNQQRWVVVHAYIRMYVSPERPLQIEAD